MTGCSHAAWEQSVTVTPWWAGLGDEDEGGRRRSGGYVKLPGRGQERELDGAVGSLAEGEGVGGGGVRQRNGSELQGVGEATAVVYGRRFTVSELGDLRCEKCAAHSTGPPCQAAWVGGLGRLTG